VVGDVATPVCPHEWNIAGEEVFFVTVSTYCENVGMLAEYEGILSSLFHFFYNFILKHEGRVVVYQT
jgi:hypothetical protein